MRENFIKISIIILSLAVFAGAVKSVLAQAPALVAPAVVNEKAKPRDILTGSFTLRNETGRKVDLYVVVYNLTGEGEEVYSDPNRGDKTVSLGHWLEITRGVIALAPQEKKEIPYKIEVNLWAKPGTYHAVIYFAPGNNRSEAEKNLGQAARALVNLEVFEEIKERLQLKRFAPEQMFFGGLPAGFSAEIENIGNRPLWPRGEIRIYDRQGKEVAALKVNETGEAVEPEKTKEFRAVWQDDFRPFGKYKAYLDLEYGVSEHKILQDTAFFWVTPWKKILLIFGAAAVLAVILSLVLHKRIYK